MSKLWNINSEKKSELRGKKLQFVICGGKKLPYWLALSVHSKFEKFLFLLYTLYACSADLPLFFSLYYCKDMFWSLAMSENDSDEAHFIWV